MGITEVIKNGGDEKIRMFWTGGAGFIFVYNGIRIGLDLYLTDSCRRENGDFKRLTLPPCSPQELELDYLISTHDHGDHFDVDAMPVIIANNPGMKVICPSSVISYAEGLGIDTKNFIKLDRGMRYSERGIGYHAVTADHGPETPDAIGVVLDMGGKRIFFAGDGTYHDNYSELTDGERDFDLMIVAINGQYGNPDSREAALIASMLNPKIVVPCHYWMFKEHGGDPMTFVNECAETDPVQNPCVLAIGEEYVL